MPPGLRHADPNRAARSSVAITIWVLLVPAAVITASYGPSSTQTMPPIDTKTLHRSREALPWGMAAPLSEAGPRWTEISSGTQVATP
jgi:hypothetical protein